MAPNLALALWKDDVPIRGNIISLQNVKEPRKELSSYKEGNVVLAICRGYRGKHKCILAKIGDEADKKEFTDILTNTERFTTLVDRYVPKTMASELQSPEQDDQPRSPSLLLPIACTPATPATKRKSNLTPAVTKVTSGRKRKAENSELRENESSRNKKLSKAANELELTELAVECQRLDEVQNDILSEKESTIDISALIGESLNLALPQNPQDNCNSVTSGTNVNHENISDNTVKNLRAEISQLHMKIASLENTVSNLWGWVHQIQHDVRSATFHQAANATFQQAASTDQAETTECSKSQPAESDTVTSVPLECSEEELVGGFTMGQLEWKISHLESFSKAAALLFRSLYTPAEYVGKTLTGAGGRPSVDQKRLTTIYKIIMKKFPNVSVSQIRLKLSDLLKPCRAK